MAWSRSWLEAAEVNLAVAGSVSHLFTTLDCPAGARNNCMAATDGLPHGIAMARVIEER